MNLRNVGYLFPILTGCFLIVATSSGNSQSKPKVLSLSDLVYEEQIRTVELTPEGQPLEPAVMAFGGPPPAVAVRRPHHRPRFLLRPDYSLQL